MSKKTVIKADLIGKACKSDILSTVAKIKGIKSMEIDADKCTLTVVGAVDPVRIARKLKKACFAATIVSVEDVDKSKKDEKKDPCKDACDKLCKAKCDKQQASCCKECKDKCEKECKDKCEARCKDWLEKGTTCSCGGDGGGCCTTTTSPAGISYTPYSYCPVPSYYPYYYNYGGGGGWPYGGVCCYEDTSPAGQCTIQ